MPASIRETSSVVVGKKTRPTPQQYAESERPLNTQPLTQCLYQIPPLKTQRLLLKKRQEDFKSQTRGEKTPKETSSSKQGRVDTQMNLKRLWQHAQGLGPQAERRSGHVTPSLTQKLSPVDNHLYIQVISKGVSLWKQTTLKACPALDGQRNMSPVELLEAPCLKILCQGFSSFIFCDFSYFLVLFTLQVRCLYGIPKYVNEWVSASVSVSWVYYGFLLLLLVCFLLLGYLGFCFIMLYFIIIP